MINNSKHEKIYPRPLSGAQVSNLPPSLVPARVPLKGRYVSLEPQEASKHAEELYQASHGTEEALRIWEYLTYGPWENVDAFAANMRKQSGSFDPVFYTIRPHDSGKACGQASYLDIHAENGVSEIGHIWLAPELQRTFAATEALFLMLCYAMDDLGYRRMQWRCNALNEKSRVAARRLGFRFEGIFYNNLIFKGQNRDTAWYSILDNEWPEVREIISDWLDPSNIDAKGKPKTSMTEAMAKRCPSKRSSE